MQSNFRLDLIDNSDTIVFREANALDAGNIQRLYQTLSKDENVQVLPERIEYIAQDSNNYLYLIELDQSTVGSCFLTLCLDPMYSEQPYAVLENIIISPEFRKQGLGTYMLTAIERICFEKNCSKLMLLSSANRVKAHSFFQSIGFSKSKKIGFIKYRRDFIFT